MEVLNKNQRETATWRLLGFGLLVLAVNAAILFSSYKAFAGKGSGEEEKLRREIKANDMTAQGREQGLQNKLNAKEAEVAKLKTESTSCKTEKSAMKTQYDLLKQQKDFLNERLIACQTSN